MGPGYSKAVKNIFVNKFKGAIFIALVIAVLAVFWAINSSKNSETSAINDFEACAEEGYPIMESYPRQCRTSDGRLFVEEISPAPEEEKIRIFSPKPKENVASPLRISGEARGGWFFEASFPVYVQDEKGRELGRGIASANGDWMTEEFVPFGAEIIFETGGAKNGVIVFEKDNPSGLPENADEVRVPVLFESVNKKSVKLFYYNRMADPDVSCSDDAVQSVEREIGITKSPIKDTMELLIRGEISDAERDAGFMSEFPIEGLKLKGVNLKEGVLSVEFADSMNKTGGGSCKVNLMRAQIEKTAKQFAEVEEVKILPEEAFQP